MKKLLLTAASTLIIAGGALAVVPAFTSADGATYGFRHMAGTVQQDQTQTRLTAQDQLRLHDGSGVRHANCDGTPGDMHRYQGSD